MTITVEQRQDIEKQIVSTLVEQALKRDFFISVWDGEEWALRFSTNQEAIMKEMFATDEEMLVFHCQSDVQGLDPRRLGTATLIYGNSGWDVISDYSWSDTSYQIMHDLLSKGPVQDLVDRLEKECH
jgi:hypothetical protein